MQLEGSGSGGNGDGVGVTAVPSGGAYQALPDAAAAAMELQRQQAGNGGGGGASGPTAPARFVVRTTNASKKKQLEAQTMDINEDETMLTSDESSSDLK